MDQKAFERSSIVASAYTAIDNVLQSGVLDTPRHPLFEAAFTSLVIHLKDLLMMANADGNRIAFTDDVDFVFGKPCDVTTLVVDIRNAMCHVDSPKHNLSFGRLRLMVITGLSPNAMVDDVISYGCNYQDDIAIQYGPVRVYLNRHVMRALTEVRKVIPG
uniref:hypothetical protein n=1 Tax=Xanthomonas sp. 0924 TaxID=2835534 RepID=UPI003F80F844